MHARYRVPSYSLTLDDAVEIWKRRLRGELYSRIAADFDVNQGRIADVLKRRIHPESERIARDQLVKGFGPATLPRDPGPQLRFPEI